MFQNIENISYEVNKNLKDDTKKEKKTVVKKTAKSHQWEKDRLLVK